MKKTIFLLITIAYSFGALGQQQIMLNRRVSIELPADAKRVTKDDALAHVKHCIKIQWHSEKVCGILLLTAHLKVNISI
jgi:hypothetical protein